MYRVKIPRLQPLIELLQTKTIEIIDYDEVVPDNRALANELGITVSKCNSWLKKLQEELIEDFRLNKPLEINEVVHDIIIMLHYEEWKQTEKDSNWEHKSFSIRLNLKSTPRVGESIEFESVPANHFYRGIVHDINHIIEGKKQIIQVWVHPWENEYSRWIRLKDEYERRY
ncbi:MAG: hypothetical protein PHH93_10090 [Prolixibacteraceae bacterium]|nr:hypothetical protein [Prolixibacteraceae bacterium]